MSEEKELSFDEAWDLQVNAESGELNAPDTSANDSVKEETVVEANDQDTTSTTHSETGADDSAVTPASIEEAVAQAKLWEQRFKSYEGRMNAEMERRRAEELERQKQFVEALKDNKPTSSKQSAAEDTKPSKFQELAKDFPEIAEAVEELLNQRMSGAEELMKKAVEERVLPIATDISRQKVSSHMERILAKHPDAVNLRKAGSLDSWINKMPVYAQHGANYVLDNGTADEVVALLDQYKDYIQTKTNNQNTDKSTNDPGARHASQGMVEAVKAGLAVKSGRSADPKTEVKKSPKDDFDAGWEDAIKKLGMN